MTQICNQRRNLSDAIVAIKLTTKKTRNLGTKMHTCSRSKTLLTDKMVKLKDFKTPNKFTCDKKENRVSIKTFIN